MQVKLIRRTDNAQALCGEAAAICTNSKNHEAALRHSTQSGHESVIEHAVYTFRVEGVSRVLLAQLTRHRVASYSVESQRYVDYKTEPEWIVPPEIADESGANQWFRMNCNHAWQAYRDLVNDGVKPEDARFLLPSATPTNLIVTMNARELMHFFSLRCCERAQWEIREMAKKMLVLCKREDPVLFERAGAQCIRLGYCPEARPCKKRSVPTKKELFEGYALAKSMQREEKS